MEVHFSRDFSVKSEMTKIKLQKQMDQVEMHVIFCCNFDFVNWRNLQVNTPVTMNTPGTQILSL